MDPALPAGVELVLVGLPALVDSGHDGLVLGVVAQAVVVFVAFEPGIIHVSELGGAFEPNEGTLLVAEQSVDSSQPISAVAVDDLFGTVLEQAGIDLLPPPA